MEANLVELLVHAAFNGKQAAVQQLASEGVKINGWNDNGITPLQAAIEQADVTMMGLLLSLGADPNKTTSMGWWTPLHYAIDSSADIASQAGTPDQPDARMIQILLDHGADPFFRSGCGKTALQMALRLRHESAIQSIQNRSKQNR